MNWHLYLKTYIESTFNIVYSIKYINKIIDKIILYINKSIFHNILSSAVYRLQICICLTLSSCTWFFSNLLCKRCIILTALFWCNRMQSIGIQTFEIVYKFEMTERKSPHKPIENLAFRLMIFFVNINLLLESIPWSQSMVLHGL